MTQAHKTPGNLVKIKEEMFGVNSWGYPYYESYKGHFFKVLSIEEGNHISIQCISGLMSPEYPDEQLVICIHDGEIQSLTKEEKKKFK